MKKITIDTNLLVRYFKRDIIEDELERIETILLSDSHISYFNDLVISELIFVLNSHYKQSRHDISEFILSIINFKNVECNKSIIQQSLEIYLLKPKLSFVDIYTFIDAKNNNRLPVYTLDQALQKFDQENIISPN